MMATKYSKELIDKYVNCTGDEFERAAKATQAIAMMMYNQQYPNG